MGKKMERLRKHLFEEGGISMKITDELKGKLENAGSAEEAKKILGRTKEAVEDAGVILDDAELDQAAGGGCYDVVRGEIGNWHFV